MISTVFCTNLQSILFSRGRTILASAQCRHSLRALVIASSSSVDKLRRVSETVSSSPQTVQQTDLLSSSSQTHSLIRRHIQIKPSKTRTRALSSLYSWDKVSPDFTLVYENGLKNWVLTYYVSQAVFGVVSCSFFGYVFSKHMDALQDSLQFIIASYCIITSVFLSGNYWFQKLFIRIYHNPQSNQFVAVRRSCFGRLKKLYYNSADVVLSSKPQDKIDEHSMVKIRGQTCHLKSAYFVSATYYNMHVEGQQFTEMTESYVRGPKC